MPQSPARCTTNLPFQRYTRSLPIEGTCTGRLPAIFLRYEAFTNTPMPLAGTQTLCLVLLSVSSRRAEQRSALAAGNINLNLQQASVLLTRSRSLPPGTPREAHEHLFGSNTSSSGRQRPRG